MAVHESTESRFGARIRVEREVKKWSQAELAQRVSALGVPMHPTTITKIESRDQDRPRSIRLDEAYALAQVFGTSIDALLGSEPKYDQAAAIRDFAATSMWFSRSITDGLSELGNAHKRIRYTTAATDEPEVAGIAGIAESAKRSFINVKYQRVLELGVEQLLPVLSEIARISDMDWEAIVDRLVEDPMNWVTLLEGDWSTLLRSDLGGIAEHKTSHADADSSGDDA